MIIICKFRFHRVLAIDDYCMYIIDSRGCIHAAQAPFIVKQMVFCGVGFSTLAIEHAIAILCVTIDQLYLKHIKFYMDFNLPNSKNYVISQKKLCLTLFLFSKAQY